MTRQLAKIVSSPSPLSTIDHTHTHTHTGKKERQQVYVWGKAGSEYMTSMQALITR